jgi:hypothetical protein
MNIIPLVYPSSDQEGVELTPAVTALYDFELEKGTVKRENCFLVKKSSELNNNAIETIPSSVSFERIDLASLNPYTAPDYGDQVESGELFRTLVTIAPDSLLQAHTEYSVVLSKDISAITVFDPEPGISNTGKTPYFVGPYTGLIEDTYAITITQSGDQSSCSYAWTRTSDSFSESNISGSLRQIEFDEGIFIKFQRGDYEAGDTFSVRVRPQQKINQTFAWNFSTGDSAYQTPDDEDSGTVINLPVDNGTDQVGTGGFSLTSVTPYDGQTFVEKGASGVAVISGVVFQTATRTDTLNDKRIKVIDGGALSLYELGGEIIIEIEEGITTNEQVVDIMNLAALGLVATTSTPTSVMATHASGVLVLGGENGTDLVFEFNKNIDPATPKESIKVIYESLTSMGKGSLDFTHEIQDNKLIIKFS